MAKHQVMYGMLDGLLHKHLLLEGMGGCGKTNALKEIAKELVRNEKTVCYLDSRNELLDHYEDFSGTSMESMEVTEEKIESGFNHIHFGEDIVFTQKEYQLDFLLAVIKKVDYLVVDDAYLLVENIFNRKDEDLKNISDICESILSVHPSIKFIFAVQRRDYFQEQDLDYIQNLCTHQLLFRLSPSRLEKNEQYLGSLGVGEAVLFENQNPLTYYSFYRKMSEKDKEYIKQHMKNGRKNS